MAYTFNKTDIGFKLFVTDIKRESIFQKLFRSKEIPALPTLRYLDFVLVDLWRRNAFSASALEHFHFALHHPGLGTWVDPVPVLRTGCFPSHFVRSSTFLSSALVRIKGKTFG